MSLSLKLNTLPIEVVANIIGQLVDQQPQWVRLTIPDDNAYFLICLNEPSPLLRVDRKFREAMIIYGLTLRLRAVDADGNPKLVKFNPKKDTRYLDLGINSLVEPLSLTRLSNAIPARQIKHIERLAIAYRPALTPENLVKTAPRFVQDLHHFQSLRRLDIVRQGSFHIDTVADVLEQVVSVAELGANFANMAEEDLTAVVDPKLQAWLNQVQSFTEVRGITVGVGAGGGE